MPIKVLQIEITLNSYLLEMWKKVQPLLEAAASRTLKVREIILQLDQM
jgi:hypothetical protein